MSDVKTAVIVFSAVCCGTTALSLLTMAGTETEIRLRGTENDQLPGIAFTGMMSGMSCLCLCLTACYYQCYKPCLTESMIVGTAFCVTSLAGLIGSAYIGTNQQQALDNSSHVSQGGGGLLAGLFVLVIGVMCCCGTYSPGKASDNGSGRSYVLPPKLSPIVV